MKSRNFVEIDEAFICENCGKKVEKLGYSCRNHCPYCLHSKHVDKNPGDRAENCHGDLEPMSLEIDGKKGYIIVFKCKKCGSIRKNKAAKDDNMNLIIKLSGAIGDVSFCSFWRNWGQILQWGRSFLAISYLFFNVYIFFICNNSGGTSKL